jgi:SAM-dependent methyltransferase
MLDNGNGSSSAPSAPGEAGSLRRRRLGLRKALVILGCLVVVMAVGVRVYLYEVVANREIDGSPLPRPDVDAPYIPTPQDVVDKMVELAEVDGDDLLYDLGCGDGRIVVTAAKRYGCRAVGFDNNPQRVKDSLENVKKGGVESLVTIEQKDIFTLDLSPADAVTMYLLPRLNEKLIPQLEKLAPGARIVSHDWDLPGFKPAKVVEVFSEEDRRDHSLLLWIAPLIRE